MKFSALQQCAICDWLVPSLASEANDGDHGPIGKSHQLWRWLLRGLWVSLPVLRLRAYRWFVGLD